MTNQTDHFHTPLVKLMLQFREGTQFGGADRGEVGRVGEQDGPAIADEFVKVNVALGGQCLEVGS